MKNISKTLKKSALLCLIGTFFLISIDSFAQRNHGGGVKRPGGATHNRPTKPATQTRPNATRPTTTRPDRKSVV